MRLLIISLIILCSSCASAQNASSRQEQLLNELTQAGFIVEKAPKEIKPVKKSVVAKSQESRMNQLAQELRNLGLEVHQK